MWQFSSPLPPFGFYAIHLPQKSAPELKPLEKISLFLGRTNNYDLFSRTGKQTFFEQNTRGDHALRINDKRQCSSLLGCTKHSISRACRRGQLNSYLAYIMTSCSQPMDFLPREVWYQFHPSGVGKNAFSSPWPVPVDRYRLRFYCYGYLFFYLRKYYLAFLIHKFIMTF